MNIEKITLFLQAHQKKLIPAGIFIGGVFVGAVLFSSDNEDAYPLITYKGGEITNVDFANYILEGDAVKKYTNDLLESKMIELESKRLKVSLTEEEKNDVLHSLYTSYGGENAFLEYLSYNNLKKEVIIQHHFDELLLEKIVLANFPYSDKELEAFFQEHYNDFITPTSYDYLEIVVSDKTLADELYTRLSKGESFETLSKQYSEVPSASTGGGLLGVSQNDIHANVLSKLSSMKPNTMSSVFEGGLGYTIVSLVKKTETTEATFESSKALVDNRYKKHLISQNYTKWFDEAKKRYNFSSLTEK